MAYLDKDGNIRSDEAQDLHNRQLGELEERLNSIENELSYCAGINEALQSDQSFQEMIVHRLFGKKAIGGVCVRFLRKFISPFFLWTAGMIPFAPGF